MENQMQWGGGRLLELDEQECWELLAAGEVARVAWTSPTGPTMHPVNHAVGDGVIWLRTTAYSQLTQEADESPVALEVDNIDDFSHGGWSVLVRGTAHLQWPGEAPEHPPLEPWAEGVRPVWVQIRPREITGRRLLPS